MRKLLSAVLAATMVMSMTACGGSQPAATTAAPAAPAAETKAEETKAEESKAEEAPAAELETVQKGKLVMVTNAEFPPYEFHLADAMIANFYLPYSTQLMMTCAYGGYDLVMKAYKEALKYNESDPNNRYRFGTYGDAILILQD